MLFLVLCLDYLITQFNINQDKAQEIAFISNGNINKAIHILNNYEEYTALLNDFKEFARLAIKFEMASIDQWIKKYESEGREALKRFLEYSLDIFHYSLLQHFHLQDKIKATQQEKDFIAKFYPYANEDNIPKLYELFNDAYHHTVRNANVRILLTDLFLRCNELFKKKVNV
jgi:DNA polymerase-3 subunit delta'